MKDKDQDEIFHCFKILSIKIKMKECALIKLKLNFKY